MMIWETVDSALSKVKASMEAVKVYPSVLLRGTQVF